MRVVLLTALAGLLALPAATGHGTYEAQELELHVLNDEGTDTIEVYGGYDITEAFLGSAYVPDLGDVVYLRLELYGQFTDPTALMPWTVRVHYDAGGPQEHFLTSTDGATFTHDFGGLEFDFDVEERSTHIQRAYLTHGAPMPGQPLTGLRIESFWGDDLRDIAPGGIPIPGTAGALEYPDPTAIEGQGTLLATPVPPTTDAYFGLLSAHRNGTAYTLLVENGLQSGGQHFSLAIQAQEPWTVNPVAAQQAVEAARYGNFSFTAEPGSPDAEPLVLELTSDVGGRLLVQLHADGTLQARGAPVPLTVTEEPALEAPGLLLPVILAALAVALASRMARSER